MADALAAGHRSMILQSLFGTQRGWIADFDWQDVGPRFFEPIPDGKYQGFTIAKWLPEMIWEYYKLSGRHERTGQTLQRHAGETRHGRVFGMESIGLVTLTVRLQLLSEHSRDYIPLSS